MVDSQVVDVQPSSVRSIPKIGEEISDLIREHTPVLLKEVIEPRVFHRHKYSSLLIVLFVIGLAESFGFIGVILAPPLAVAMQILFRQLYPFPATLFSQEVSGKVADIRTRLLQWRRRTQNHANRKNRLLINRVYSLIKRTANYLQDY